MSGVKKMYMEDVSDNILEVINQINECGKKINIDFLIVEVEVHQVLYIKSMHDNVQAIHIKKSWSEVANALNVDVADCIDLWMKLVQVFKQIHKAMLTESMLNEVNIDWIYYEQLIFLIPYLDGDLVEEIDTFLLNSMEYEENSSSRLLTNGQVYDLPITADKLESDELFLLSCLPILKRLSPERNAYARIKLLELLYTMEFDDKTN